MCVPKSQKFGQNRNYLGKTRIFRTVIGKIWAKSGILRHQQGIVDTRYNVMTFFFRDHNVFVTIIKKSVTDFK